MNHPEFQAAILSALPSEPSVENPKYIEIMDGEERIESAINNPAVQAMARKLAETL